MERVETGMEVKIPSHASTKAPEISFKEYFLFYFLRDLVGFFIARVVLFSHIAPFGLAFYAASIPNTNHSWTALLSIILGIISGMGFQGTRYVFALILFSSLLEVYRRREKNISLLHTIIGSSTTLFFINLYEAYVNDFVVQELLLQGMEVILCAAMTFLFSQGVSLFMGKMKRSKLSNQEMISICILVGLVVAGFIDVQIYEISLKYVFCILVVMAVGYQGGSHVGSTIGTIVGTILAFTNTVTPFIIAIFAICGLLSGLFQEFGRIGAGLGFFIGNLILGFYLYHDFNQLLFWKEVLLALGILYCIPNKLLEQMAISFRYKDALHKEVYHQKMKRVTIEKLQNFSQAFSKLSTTFSKLAETKPRLNKDDISKMFNEIAERNCSACGMCNECWERNFYQTYQAMFSMLTTAEKKGRVGLQEIPKEFENQCVKVKDFVDSMNQMFEIYKLNLMWHNKVAESRQLVADQLEGVSKVVGDLVKDLDLDLQFKEELEHNIMIELDKSNIRAKEALVIENKNGQYEVSIAIENCSGRFSCSKDIMAAVSRVLGRPMVRGNDYCDWSAQSKCTIKLIEQQKYRISTGIAKLSKEKESPSGDSFSFIELKNGHSIIALSDGMGSGYSANLESGATIELLEQFLELGFDKEIAVNLINSILVLKSSEDSFSTIDLALVDHYTGKGEFVKIGAATSFIKRERHVEVIKSTSLPVGILKNVDMEVTEIKLQDGDYIIMMTDGVLDAFEGFLNKEDWMISVLYQIDSSNPKEIADFILEKAKEKSGEIMKDDMTVMVSKIWKKSA